MTDKSSTVLRQAHVRSKHMYGGAYDACVGHQMRNRNACAVQHSTLRLREATT